MSESSSESSSSSLALFLRSDSKRRSASLDANSSVEISWEIRAGETPHA